MPGSTPEPVYTIADILRSTDYKLDLFTPDEVAALEIFDQRGKPYLHDPISRRDRPAKPEEIVRQLFLRQLIDRYGYPPERIGVEQPVRMGRDTSKSADIIIWDADDPDAAYIIVEIKRPKKKDGIEQLKTYANAQGAPIAAWTNGAKLTILHREEPNHIFSRRSCHPGSGNYKSKAGLLALPANCICIQAM